MCPKTERWWNCQRAGHLTGVTLSFLGAWVYIQKGHTGTAIVLMLRDLRRYGAGKVLSLPTHCEGGMRYVEHDAIDGHP